MRRASLVAYLAAACAADASAPFLVSVQDDPSGVENVRLTWEPAGGHVDSYAVDWRAPGGAFAEIVASAGPYQAIALSQLPPDVPEIEFRIRAEPGARGSNGVVYRRGKVPASVVSVFGPDQSRGNAIIVTYANPSQIATQVRLERRTAQLDGATGPWAQVDVGNAKTNTYEDRDLSEWTDGARYEYRATVIDRGTTPSAPLGSFRAPLLPPAAVEFTPGGSGATLLIRSNSRYAKRIAVERGNGEFFTRDVGAVAAPPAGQTVAFVDGPLPPGLFLYKLRAKGDFATESPPSTSWVAVPDPGSRLGPRILDLQQGISAVRDASGKFGVVEQLNENFFPSGVAAFPPGGDGSSGLVVNSNVALKYLLDVGGHPHTAYYEWAGSAATVAPIVHAWHDGTRWQTEEIARRTFVTAVNEYSNEIAFDIGLDGTLFAAWAGAAGIEVASRTAGGPWKVEVVSPDIVSMAQSELMVSGDEAGVPHVIHLSFRSAHFFPGAGGWQSEPIPLFVFVTYSSFGAWAFAGFGRIDVVTRIYASSAVDLVQRTAAGWAPPTAVTTATWMSAARSADGRAVAIAASDGTLWTLRDGAVTQTKFFPFGRPAVGVGADGKAWVVEWLSDGIVQLAQGAAAPALLVPAAVFEER